MSRPSHRLPESQVIALAQAAARDMDMAALETYLAIAERQGMNPMSVYSLAREGVLGLPTQYERFQDAMDRGRARAREAGPPASP